MSINNTGWIYSKIDLSPGESCGPWLVQNQTSNGKSDLFLYLYMQGFHNVSYLSDYTDDEDAIHINVMRDFARLENSKMKSDDEFSASACQKIHSELLASVNELYKNLKTKPLLKRNAISTSSLSNVPNKNHRKLSKSKSIDCKQNGPVVSIIRTKTKEETIGPMNNSGKLPKHLRRRVEKNLGKYSPLDLSHKGC